MDCKSSIPSSNLGVALKQWGYGGMVDTTDLKSVDRQVVRVQVPLPPMESLPNLLINKYWRIFLWALYQKYTNKKNVSLLVYFADGETRTLKGIPART